MFAKERGALMKQILFVLAGFVILCGQVLGSIGIAGAVDRVVGLGIDRQQAEALVVRWANEGGGHNVMPLVNVLEQASTRGAPIDLVINKTAEGLAKQLPQDSLLVFLEVYSKELAHAVKVVRSFGEEAENSDPEKEMILRFWALHRTKPNSWMDFLALEARKNHTTLTEYLRVCKTVGQLSQLGIQEQKAQSLGVLWLEQRLKSEQLNMLLKIVRMRKSSTGDVLKAVERATEDFLKGMSPGEVLDRSTGK